MPKTGDAAKARELMVIDAMLRYKYDQKGSRVIPVGAVSHGVSALLAELHELRKKVKE